MPRWRVSGPAIAAGVAWLLVAAPAFAAEPLTVDDPITDRVGALADRRDEVAAAQERLFEDHRLELYVVYVDDFGGHAAADWAAETASNSRFGINQALLAVATTGREFDLAVDPDYPLTSDQLAEIKATAIAPAMRQYDWTGAAIGAADGLRAVLGGEPVQAPAVVPGDPQPAVADEGIGWVVVIAVVGTGVVLVAAGYLYWRSRRRGRLTSSTPHAIGEEGSSLEA